LNKINCKNIPTIQYHNAIANSALTLLVGQQEGHPVVGCWCDYLSGAKYRLGPADVTAADCLLLQ